jgi:RNA methyltransferase, TrmH family
MITSPHNEKLKLIRRLQRRRARERDGLFVGEGEDLLAAARAAGARPVELLTAAGEGLGGTEVEPALLDRFSALGSGTRAIGVWERRWAERPVAPCVYLHGVADPGNVGTVVRAALALVGGSVVLGPGCADPFGGRAVRASMGALFAEPLVQASVGATPAPRAALVAHGGEPLDALAGGDDLPGGRAGGSAGGRPGSVRGAGDDPGAAGSRVPERGRGRGDRPAADIDMRGCSADARALRKERPVSRVRSNPFDGEAVGDFGD